MHDEQEFTVIDGFRRITFNGVLLAKASSRRPGVWRWTDLALYRTHAGTYVLEKVGASRVTHVVDCEQVIDDLPRFQEIYPGMDPDDPEFTYCTCVPEMYDFPSLLVERDRNWAQISNSAASVVRSLMRYRDGSRWLPRTSVQLLSRASELDIPIRTAYLSADSVIA